MTVTVTNDNHPILPQWIQTTELGKVELKGKGVYSVASLRLKT
jgi:hypothetical protein